MEQPHTNATASSSRQVPLPKGAACLPCRKKKLRCDAKRPKCSSCERSHASNRGGNQKAPCVWDDEDQPPPTRTSDGSASEEADGERVGGKKKRKAEERGGAQQAYIEEEDVLNIQIYGARPLPETWHIDTISSGPPPTVVFQPSSSTSNSFFYVPPTATSTDRNRTTPFQSVCLLPTAQPPQSSFHHPLIYSSYPSTLPPPPLLFYLVEIFFSKVPTLPKMINRTHFLTSLRTLPPTHPAFPSVAVLHAIVALAVRHCGREELKDEFKTKPPENDQLGKEDGVNIYESEMESFRGRHARLAKEGIDRMVGGKGDRLFEAVVAAVILEGFDYQEARWVQSWLDSAFSIRLAVPLGLHQANNGSGDSFATDWILPRTEDTYELELRRRTFWLGLLSDRRSSISSKWAHSLSDEDISVGLPTRLDQFKRGPGSHITLNPQTLAAPDLFTYNPPEHTDSFVLNIKSTILLRRTQVLTENLQEAHLPLGVDPRSTLPFQEAQRQIEKYRDSFSLSSLRDPQGRGGMVDGDMILASTLPHIALIYLHEDYASVLSRGDPSATVLLQAARAILGSVVSLCSTSYEFASFPPFLAFCWFIGGRTLTRFYQALLFIGDFAAAELAMNEIRAFQIGLQRFAANCPLAEKEIGMLNKAVSAASSFPAMGPPEPCTAGFKPIHVPNPTPSLSDSSAYSSTSSRGSASASGSPQNTTTTTTAFSPSSYFFDASSPAGTEKDAGVMLGAGGGGEWFPEFGDGDLEVLLGTSFVGVSS